MARVNGVVEIDAGENGEDIGLQEGDQRLQRHQNNDHAEGQNAAGPAERAHGVPIRMMKPAKTCSVMCPASMLANRRTECEIGRETKDSTSMKTISGRM